MFFNLISVGALEALGLVISVRDGVLKMIKSSMVVMKGVRRDNLYYLKGSYSDRSGGDF